MAAQRKSEVKIQDKEKMNRLIADNIQPLKGESILNIGCGCGALAKVLRDRGFEVKEADGNHKNRFEYYDCIVATHFHSFKDIKEMCRIAKKRVFIVIRTDNEKKVQQSHVAFKGDIYSDLKDIFDMLYMYGISPNVKVIKDDDDESIICSLVYWDVKQ